MPEAPFPSHQFVFHADGPVEQSNPDGGDAGTSDSNLIGASETEGGHKLAAQGEMTFTLSVGDDQSTGKMQAMSYDAEHKPVRGLITATLTGKRIRS